MSENVRVPDEWKRIGFSGLFWTEIEVAEGYKGEPPCLIDPGWLLLSRDGATGILVRRDENAIVDVGTGRIKPLVSVKGPKP